MSSETGELKWFQTIPLGQKWLSCQVGKTRLFQAGFPQSLFRILKIDPTQRRCFTVERRQRKISKLNEFFSLANFRDQFIFLIQAPKRPKRYSLTEDKWEDLPVCFGSYGGTHACSLGDKVYAFAYKTNCINVLHNPTAPISSQEEAPPHWQNFFVPLNLQQETAFVPLNTTEIAILGGTSTSISQNAAALPLRRGENIIFNTTTRRLKQMFEDKVALPPFRCLNNQAA